MRSKLPAFSTVIKSRAVEDPINVWLHRPLAYACVALIYRTPITPNQVTFCSMSVGLGAAICFVHGEPHSMLLGGILLWSSAILDGADGILARAKRLQSDAGRAIDGVADAVVGLTTVSAGFYHLLATQHDMTQLALMPLALGTALIHIYSYDFYKESYLYRTRLDWDGHPERASDVRERLQRMAAQKAPWYAVLATKIYGGEQLAAGRFVALTNPAAQRDGSSFPVSSETVRIYTQLNTWPMRLWAANSLAPHSYLMSICAMFDRLDLYLYFRVVPANVLFIVTLLVQRSMTQRTNLQLSAAGLAAWPATDSTRAP